MMAYDERLADRVCELIGSLAGVRAAQMFGGPTFMVNTHMVCGSVKDDLMAPTGSQKEMVRPRSIIVEVDSRMSEAIKADALPCADRASGAAVRISISAGTA